MNVAVEYFLSPESLWLRRLKDYVRLSLYKGHCKMFVNWKLYKYLMGLGDEKFARLVPLFVVFSGSDDKVTVLSESDIARFIGVSSVTASRCMAKYKDMAFQILDEEHVASCHRYFAGESDHIAFNSYMLCKQLFEGFASVSPVSRKDSWLNFSVEYKGLDMESYLVECYDRSMYNKRSIYNNVYDQTHHPSTPIAYYTYQNNAQQIDNQFVEGVFFNHFKNPIYKPKFDEEKTPYPVNWCRHPDGKAFFSKGRWYGTIHRTEKGEERMEYLGPMGLTHEIDLHNAIFYFMLALLPDSVSETDRAMYFELVKSGRLYDDAVDMLTKENREFYTLPLPWWMEDMPIGLSREEVKDRFQRYRNSKGKTKQRIKDIDWYFERRFPTIREWLLTQKQMQNRLAWIETDFMSRVCEKLSDGNIRFEWLHDAVYVSESDSARAQEILDSVREEFENAILESKRSKG